MSRFRVGVSALLLAAQIFGLAHVASADHTPTDAGTIADRGSRRIEEHDDAHSHLCAGDLYFHEAEDCMVIAALRAPSVLVPRTGAQALPRPTEGTVSMRTSLESAPLAPLSRAPKASPPKS